MPAGEEGSFDAGYLVVVGEAGPEDTTLVQMKFCRVYWGSHACMYERGHSGPHECHCAYDEHGNREPRFDEDRVMNVGAPPYYGPDTEFYGEDAPTGGGDPTPFRAVPLK